MRLEGAMREVVVLAWTLLLFSRMPSRKHFGSKRAEGSAVLTECSGCKSDACWNSRKLAGVFCSALNVSCSALRSDTPWDSNAQ